MNSGSTRFLDLLALILVIIGALNWGILVVFNRDLLMGVLRLGSDFANVIYVVVAVSGLWCLFSILPKFFRKRG